jgi:hypothetical protein
MLGAIWLAACGGGGGGGSPAPAAAPDPAPAPVQIPAAQSKTFVDVTLGSGIDYVVGHSSLFLVGSDSIRRSATGGAAAGDYDADGDIDLFITRGDIGPNLLYRNNGAGVFEDVAAAAGLAFTATATETYRHSGPIFADMDGDRDLDLFLGGLSGDPAMIFANNGDGTFTNVTAGSGIDNLVSPTSITAAFGDYDLDGDLDMFISHYETLRDRENPGDTEHLWRNDSADGRIRFTSVSVEAGISPSILTQFDPYVTIGIRDFTFTPAFARIDDDLYPDLLSVADFNFTRYYHNNGDGTFANATDPEVLTDTNGMGSALGDYDHDGDLDWFVTSINDNRLYENDGGTFIDRTDELDVRNGGWGWGACMFDFENDGDLDIYHTNGWEVDAYRSDISRAFVGSGGGPFVESAEELGLDDTQDGRGVVCADFDNDGDVDILQLHRDSTISATMWRNDTNGNNFLRVKLIGQPPNTEAAGARIYLTIGAVTQMREIMIGNNFVSQNPAIQIFGLGNATQADEIRVQWPDGRETIDSAVAANRTLTLSHPDL